MSVSVSMSGLGAVGLGVGWGGGLGYQPGVYVPLKALFLVCSLFTKVTINILGPILLTRVRCIRTALSNAL